MNILLVFVCEIRKIINFEFPIELIIAKTIIGTYTIYEFHIGLDDVP